MNVGPSILRRRMCVAVLVLAVTLGLPSCRRAVERAQRDIAVERVVEVARLGSAGAAVTLRVRNDSRRTLRLDEARFGLYLAGGLAAEFLLHEPVRVEPRTTTDCRSIWRVKVEDPMAYYALQRRIRAGAGDRIEISVRITGRGGGVPVKISRERMPLSEFLNTFGVTIEDLENFLEE